MNEVKVDDEKLKAVLNFYFLGGACPVFEYFLKYIDKDLSSLFQRM